MGQADCDRAREPQSVESKGRMRWRWGGESRSLCQPQKELSLLPWLKWKTARQHWIEVWQDLTYILIGSFWQLCWEKYIRRKRQKQGDQFRNYWNNLGNWVDRLDCGDSSRGGSQPLNTLVRESWQNVLIDWAQTEEGHRGFGPSHWKYGTANWKNWGWAVKRL